jgi:aryl carrier-like protein
VARCRFTTGHLDLAEQPTLTAWAELLAARNALGTAAG